VVVGIGGGGGVVVSTSQHSPRTVLLWWFWSTITQIWGRVVQAEKRRPIGGGGDGDPGRFRGGD
jgi:hypothetical protein